MELNPEILDLAVRLALVKAILQNGDDDDSHGLSSIEKIFASEEKIKGYLAEGNYSDANDLAEWRYNQDSSLHSAPVLVQYYVTLVQNDAPLKAGEIKDELITLLSGVETAPKPLEQFGKKLHEENKPYEAILFYQVAIHYCRNERDVNTVVNCILRCCAGTSVIVREGIEKSEMSKDFANNHIVPYMKQGKALMGRHLLVNKKQVSEAIATCLHCVEQVQNEAGDLNGRESTLREAIALLRDNHGREVEKNKIFGTCLNNMGHTLLMKRRFDEAKRYFNQAISAKQKAEDYDSEADKKKDVLTSRAGLRAAQRGECLIQ